ncbi:MAG: hypothetical protein WAV73_04085 [Candidatus Moraniibacteriota bacterium]
MKVKIISLLCLLAIAFPVAVYSAGPCTSKEILFKEACDEIVRFGKMNSQITVVNWQAIDEEKFRQGPCLNEAKKVFLTTCQGRYGKPMFLKGT